MGNTSVKITGFKEALTNILRNKTRIATSKIANELTEFTNHAILGFYDHYQPTRYKRQGGLSGAFARYYRNPHNTIYHGGVEILPSKGSYTGWREHHKIGVDSSFITQLAIFNGMHGNVAAFPHPPLNIPQKMLPTPYKLITKKRDDIVKNIDSYFNE